MCYKTIVLQILQNIDKENVILSYSLQPRPGKFYYLLYLLICSSLSLSLSLSIYIYIYIYIPLYLSVCISLTHVIHFLFIFLNTSTSSLIILFLYLYISLSLSFCCRRNLASPFLSLPLSFYFYHYLTLHPYSYYQGISVVIFFILKAIYRFFFVAKLVLLYLNPTLRFLSELLVNRHCLR